MKKVTAAAVQQALKTYTLPLLAISNVINVGKSLDDKGYYLEIGVSGSADITLPEGLNTVRVVVKVQNEVE